MSKLMSAKSWGVNAGALEAMPNNRSNATRAAKTADRSFSSQKYTPTGAVWSSASQIGGYHFANLSGQG
jgi:hypothetical protein